MTEASTPATGATVEQVQAWADTVPPSPWSLDHGDALDMLGTLPDQSIDAVVTDPPYSSGGQFRADRNRTTTSKYVTSSAAAVDRLHAFYGDNRGERALLIWSTVWLAECWRVTRDGGAIVLFCDWRSYPVFADALQVAGWTWRGHGVWIKPPGKSRPTPGGLWNDSELLLWATRGARTGGEFLPGSWTVAPPASTHRLHQTEKPREILRDLVRFAPPGGVVLDPFAGSAATGVAALEQGRRFVGFELSAGYADVGRTRLQRLDTTGADVHQVGAPTLWEGGDA